MHSITTVLVSSMIDLGSARTASLLLLFKLNRANQLFRELDTTRQTFRQTGDQVCKKSVIALKLDLFILLCAVSRFEFNFLL